MIVIIGRVQGMANGLGNIVSAGLALVIYEILNRLKKLENIVNGLSQRFYVFNEIKSGQFDGFPSAEPTVEFVNGNGFVYVEGVTILNVDNQQVNTLRAQITAVLGDGLEVVVVGWRDVIIGDTVRWIYDTLPHGSVVKAIRVYLYSPDLSAGGGTANASVRLTGVASQ